jgi:hypothetical protein
MAMTQPVQVTQIEPRWPVALAIVAVFSLLTLLPGRVRAFPPWVPYLVTFALILPTVALALATAKAGGCELNPSSS